jgi:hypothetical protein
MTVSTVSPRRLSRGTDWVVHWVRSLPPPPSPGGCRAFLLPFLLLPAVSLFVAPPLGHLLAALQHAGLDNTCLQARRSPIHTLT